jgi:FG-GAP-like repeat
VTSRARLARPGWGQGECVGDYDNDGYLDLFVTYWGQNVLYRNNGDGTFTAEAGLKTSQDEWSTAAVLWITTATAMWIFSWCVTWTSVTTRCRDRDRDAGARGGRT